MRQDFWDVKPKSGISWVWRSILHGRDLLKQQGRWRIGDGAEISITEDRLLASGNLAITNQGSRASKVKDLIDSSTKGWNVGALRINLASQRAIGPYKLLLVCLC